ncbi:hypothetical protein TRICI_004561 [Trichomonascus ciferrii]|uniref:Uncharacterized protein n=1 Tax=Trichomonascus ciferrii TaxID=44093 RepID=A0A642V0L4_9ASCO|nr:hypothetical protein TRICI_004561 [Trichomonascus ciferrii]
MADKLDEFADYLELHPALWGIESFYSTYRIENPLECIRMYLRFLTTAKRDETLFSNLDVIGIILDERKHEQLSLFESRGSRAAKLIGTFKDDCKEFAGKMGWRLREGDPNLGVRALQACDTNTVHVRGFGVKRSREDAQQDGPRKKPKKVSRLAWK